MSLLIVQITIDFKHIIINIMPPKFHNQSQQHGKGSGNHGPGNHGPGNYSPGNHGLANHSPGNHGLANHSPGNHGLGNHGPGNHGPGKHAKGLGHMSKQQKIQWRMERHKLRQKQRQERKAKLEKNEISQDQQKRVQRIMKKRIKYWNALPQERKKELIGSFLLEKMQEEAEQKKFIFQAYIQEQQQQKIAETFRTPQQYQEDEEEAASRGFTLEIAIKRSQDVKLKTSPAQALIITSSEKISDKYDEQASSPIHPTSGKKKQQKENPNSMFLSRLKKVKNDRNLMEKYFLKQFSLNGILQCHQRSSIDKSYVLHSIKQFFSYQDRELAIIYYAGHGKDPSGNWVIEDKSDKNTIENQQISPYQIFQLWKGRPKPQNLKFLLLIIDSCYSGNWIDQLQNRVNIQKENQQKGETTISSISIIAACSMTKSAIEKGKYGIFTSWYYSQLYDDQKSKQIKQIFNDKKITAQRILHKNSVNFLIQNKKQHHQKNEEKIQQKKNSQKSGQTGSLNNNKEKEPQIQEQTASWRTYSMQFLQNYPQFKKIWINYTTKTQIINNSYGSFQYIGEVNQKNQFHGLGVLKKSYKKQENGVSTQFFLTQYDGEWKQGKRNGRGVQYEYDQSKFEVINRIQGKWQNNKLNKEYRYYEYSTKKLQMLQGDGDVIMPQKTLHWPHTFIGKQKQKGDTKGIVLNWNPFISNNRPIAFILQSGAIKYYIYNDGTLFDGFTHKNLQKMRGIIYKTRQILCQDQFFDDQKRQKALMQGVWSQQGQIQNASFYKILDGSQLKIDYIKNQVKPDFKIAKIQKLVIDQQKVNKPQ